MHSLPACLHLVLLVCYLATLQNGEVHGKMLEPLVLAYCQITHILLQILRTQEEKHTASLKQMGATSSTYSNHVVASSSESSVPGSKPPPPPPPPPPGSVRLQRGFLKSLQAALAQCEAQRASDDSH